MRVMLLSVFLLSFCVLSVAPAYAQETSTPGWLERTEISAQIETGKEPNFYFQTVQPLFQDDAKENTVFVQPRISLQNARTSYNIGFGYRRLMSEDLMLGANIFGDLEDLHDHARVGVGLEAFGQILEARLNTYFGVTSQRLVQQQTGSATYERVVDGLDFELGSPIPYIPWLKIYGSGFWYDYKQFDDRKGWKTRLEAKLNDGIRMEFYTWDDNKGDVEYGGRVRFNLAFDGMFDFSDSLHIADEPFPKKDLEKETLVPVERNFEIAVEKWTETANTTIQVARGD